MFKKMWGLLTGSRKEAGDRDEKPMAEKKADGSAGTQQQTENDGPEVMVKYLPVDLELFKFAGAKKFVVEKNENQLVFEGDIILGYDKVSGQAQEKALITKENKWPGRPPTIPYTFDPQYGIKRGEADYDWWAVIETALDTLREQTPITFEYQEEPYGVCHIFFTKGKNDGSYRAVLGYHSDFLNDADLQGRHHVIIPTKGDLNPEEGVVLHEICHVLGLWHEHSRNDRDQYVTINENNIKEKYKYRYDIWDEDCEPFGGYDIDSIMHYPPNSDTAAINKNEPIIISKDPERPVVGQRVSLSDGDIAALNALYPG